MAKPLFTARSKEAENITNTKKKWKMIFWLLRSSRSIVVL